MKKGSKHSEDAKEKNRFAHLGRPAWNKGLTKEHPSVAKAGFQKGHKFYSGGERGWFTSNRVKAEKNINWKGGVSRINHLIRTTQKYVKWRKEVFERDNYTCQECEIRGNTLHVHHRIPMRDIIKDHKITSLEEANKCNILWDISNGITYCDPCHSIHDKYRRRKLQEVIIHG